MLDELHAGLPERDVLVVDDGSTDRTADVAREHGAEVLSFGENRGLQRRHRRRLRVRGARARLRVRAAASTPTASIPSPSSRGCSSSSAPASADVAVGSRFAAGEGYEAYRYEPSRSRKLGTGLLRRAMRVALGRPFHDATSGMYAANREGDAAPRASPYSSGAPEVESLLRLRRSRAARRRGAGRHARARERRVEAARQEGRACSSLTVIGTLLLYGVWRRLRRPR